MILTLGKVENCFLLQSKKNKSITFENNFHNIASCIRICLPQHRNFPHQQIQENTASCVSRGIFEKKTNLPHLIREGCMSYFNMDVNKDEGINLCKTAIIKVSQAGWEFSILINYIPSPFPNKLPLLCSDTKLSGALLR